MSERCEGTSERTSEWPSTYVSILVCSRPQWAGVCQFSIICVHLPCLAAVELVAREDVMSRTQHHGFEFHFVDDGRNDDGGNG